MTRALQILLSLLFAAAALAQSADLTITGNGQQYPDRMSLLFALTNQGPDVARNAILTIDIPEGVLVERFSYGAGDAANKPCDTSQRPYRCQVGDVHVGFPFHYGGMEIRTPLRDGRWEVKFTLTSDTPDPRMSNNTSSVVWETKIESDVSVTVKAGKDRVDPGEEVLFTAPICNLVRANRPPTVRVEITGTNLTFNGVAPPHGFSCTAEGSTKFVCTAAELLGECPGVFGIAAKTGNNREAGQATVTVRAFSDLPEQNSGNDAATGVLPVYRYFAVTNTNDTGPGSLRDAITQANANCSPGPCRIIFEIPKPVPAEGWFTITPSEPLPSITAERVTLEGGWQTRFTGNTNQRGPEIAIDGRLARRGLRMLATCEGVVDGLAIGNFDEDQGLWISTGGECGGRPDKRAVTENHIGTTPEGFVPWPNRRGLRLDFARGVTVTRNVIAENRHSGIWMWRGTNPVITSNYIASNGASGVFLGPEVPMATVNDNVIRYHRDAGISVAYQARQVQMRRNLMLDNAGLAIDWGLDGVTPTGVNDHDGPSNAPVMLSARYDPSANVTRITASVDSQKLGSIYNFGYLDFFANDKPDGDGERFLGSLQTNTYDGTVTATMAGDFQGKWINATWTREHQYGSRAPGTDSHVGGFATITSELSNTVLVE